MNVTLTKSETINHTSKVVMYSTKVCPYCQLAEQLLINKGIIVNKILVDENPDQKNEMLNLSKGLRTVPQIFINNKHVGGYDNLCALDRSGELDILLANT